MTQRFHCWGYIYPEKTTTEKGTCTPVFISALFTIAKTWKQSICPLRDRCTDKEDAVHIYNGILLSHNKEQNNAICSNTDGPRD